MKGIEVASLLGISRSSVSMILNGCKRYSKVTISKVFYFKNFEENYLNKIYSGIISDSDSTDLSSILFEFLIRKLQLKDQLNLKNVELSKFIEKNVCFY